MSIRGLLAKHNALKPSVRRSRACRRFWRCRWHVVHHDGSLSHCTDWDTALRSALTYEPPPGMTASPGSGLDPSQ